MHMNTYMRTYMHINVYKCKQMHITPFTLIGICWALYMRRPISSQMQTDRQGPKSH